MHKRTQIREAIKNMLSNATLCGLNVFANRVTENHNLKRTQLPAILIYIQEENGSVRDLSSRTYVRNLTVKIEIRVEDNENLDSQLDIIANQVEDILRADISLQGNASATFYTNTFVELDDTGEKSLGKATLTFDVKYIA